MCMEDLLRNMARSFFMITTGIVISMYVFCMLFRPDAVFSIADIGKILLMAVAGDLTYIIFLAGRELNKKQMLIRKIVHLVVLSATLLYLASLWEWVRLENIQEVVVFLLAVLAVYAVIALAVGYRDKKLTEKINSRLRERYPS